MRRPALYLVLLLTSSVSLAGLPGAAAIDGRVRAAMAETRANGMADLVRFVLGETGVPYDWEYGDRRASPDCCCQQLEDGFCAA